MASCIEVQSAVPNTQTSISDFYVGKTVFITGGTGFMGKVLLEKLLRACSGVSKIYLLIRSKKGQPARDRLQQMLCSPLFDTVRKERPTDLYKVYPIEGDITEAELAISLSDRVMLAKTVNIVFHSAATVKFDEKLKLSVTINMLGTQRLVELCKRMTNLQALIHVSTAYCNCNRTEVKEVVYDPPINPDQVVSLVNALDEDIVDSLTKQLIGDRPNTYTFTKALAECWLKENKGDLPLVIVRPSIVMSTFQGPHIGWVDNWNGPTGILSAAGKGIFRSMLCDPKKNADIVPVDMVINLMLAAAWKIGTTKSTDLVVYNCVSGQRKPICWKDMVGLCFLYMKKYPFSEVWWYPAGSFTASPFRNSLNKLFLMWMPAYIIDSYRWIFGGKPIMCKIQGKLCKAATCLEYFTTHEWQFRDDNVRELVSCLSQKDQKEFCFDVDQINWHIFIKDYVLGIRKYLFKENVDSLPKARKQLSKLYWTYRILQVISILSTWYFLTLRYTPLRHLWSNTLRLLVHIARMLPFI